MIRTDSFRFRYIASTFIWIVVGLLLTGATVTYLMRSYITEQFHEELQVHVEELALLADVAADGAPRLIRPFSDPRYMVPGSGFYWQVERDGHVSARSRSLGQNALPMTPARLATPHWAIIQSPTGKAIAYGAVRPVGSSRIPARVVIATDLRILDDVLNRFEWPLGWSLSVFAIVMTITGAVQVAFGLKPIDRLKRDISVVRAGQAAHLDEDHPWEFRPLVEDLNGLLDSNREMVRHARVQAGNLAHGLRTPMAVILDEIENLYDRGQTESADILMRECDRMQRQIDYHLARARVIATGSVPGARASLIETVDPILIAMRRLHADRRISLSCAQLPDRTLACDPIDLGEILSSLLDNACKWAKHRVHVSWQDVGDTVEIAIEDDGPGIDPAARERVFGIGERLDDSVPGTGLGLAISRELVRVYGGEIRLGSSPRGGLEAVAILPRA